MANPAPAAEPKPHTPLTVPLALLGLVTAATLWSYWSTLASMSRVWAHNPQYSHGWLVPIFSAVLLWNRRAMFPADKLQPSAWGLLFLAMACGLRLFAAFFYFEWFDWASLLPAILGILLLFGGWSVVKWALPGLLFLGFMIPLPFTVDTMMRGPLRRVGTVMATYVMQTIGLPAFSEGYTIVMDKARIGVVEACSGIRMLMIFFALSTAVAILSRRPLWERLLIVASAVPIALIANVARITVTGILHETVSSEAANLVFHDLAGWLMMPLGLVLLGIEMWLLSRLFIVEQEFPLTPVPGLGASASRKSAGALSPIPAKAVARPPQGRPQAEQPGPAR
jgi:exosortase